MWKKVRTLEERLPLKVSLVYLIFGYIWILLTDMLLMNWVEDQLTKLILVMSKAGIFVTFTALIMYMLLKNYVKKVSNTEKALMDSERRLRTLINSIPDSVILKDKGGKWVEVNKSTMDLFDIDDDMKEELTGETIQNKSSVYRPIFEECKNTDQEVRKTGTHLNFEQTVEVDNQRYTYEITKVPIQYGKENDTGILVIARDITERKEMEDELRITKEKLESFINQSADAIIFFDPNNRFKQVNQAFEEIYGWKEEEVIGQRSTLTIPREYIREATTLGDLLRAGEQIRGYETVRMKKDGSLIDVSMTFAPLRDSHGNHMGYSSIVRDISERKKAEELLRKSEMLSVIGELAAGVAHEIRNPLTSLKGFIQLLKSHKYLKKNYIEIILSELDRINSIVDEFMILAKPQVVNHQKTDIKKLLHEVITLIETQAILHNIEIITRYEESIPIVKCEKNQIKQVIINLLKNAIEAMPDGGKILIKLSSEDQNQIHIEVLDHGMGIPEERLPKLGEPFYTTKEKGTGLGLMISHKIIRAHEGEIEIESELNKGTTVRILLPVEQKGNPNQIAG